MCGNNVLYDVKTETPLPEGLSVLDPWDRLYSNIAWRAGKRCTRKWLKLRKGGTRQMFTPQELPAGWVTEHSSALSPKRTLINSSWVLVHAVKKGTERRQSRRKKRMASFRMVTQRICLPSVKEKESEEKSLYSHASGATASKIKAFISFYLL